MDTVPAPYSHQKANIGHDLGIQKAAEEYGCGMAPAAARLDFVNHGHAWLADPQARAALHLPGFCRRRATLGI
jgi:hypothetical protein